LQEAADAAQKLADDALAAAANKALPLSEAAQAELDGLLAGKIPELEAAPEPDPAVEPDPALEPDPTVTP
jgi:hypothetical protein